MRLLRRNLLSLYSAYAAGVVSGLVVTPIAVRALGTEGYGVWAFIASAAVFLGLLDLGLGPSVVRFAALHRGRRTPEATAELVSTAFTAYGGVSLVTVPLGVGLAWLVPLALDLPADAAWPARAAGLLVVAGVALRFPLGLGVNLMLAQQRYDVVSLGSILGLAALTGLVAWLLPQDGGIVLLAGLTLLGTAIRLGLPALWVPRELPGLRLRLRGVTRTRLRELLAFSWHNFLVHVATKVVFSADVVLVGLLLGARAAAFYAIPARLFSFAYDAAAAGTGVLFPAFSELEGREDEAGQRRLLLGGLRLGSALALLIALPLVLLPDQLIRAWIGPGFEESTPVAILLGLALLARQPGYLLAQYLVARARPQLVARVMLVTVGVNLVLSVVLALTVGLWGVAVATLATEAVAGLVVLPRLAAGISGLSHARLLRAWARPVAPAAAAALLMLVAATRLAGADDLVTLAPVGVAWVAVLAAAVWLAGLGPEERVAVRRALGRAAPA